MSIENGSVQLESIETDSTLLGWNLCKTESGDYWVLQSKDSNSIFLSEDAELVEVDRVVPKEAIFSSPVKAQSVAKLYSEKEEPQEDNVDEEPQEDNVDEESQEDNVDEEPQEDNVDENRISDIKENIADRIKELNLKSIKSRKNTYNNDSEDKDVKKSNFDDFIENKKEYIKNTIESFKTNLFKKDKQKNIEEESEKETLIDTIKKYLSTEIEDIDQERPDAQNVSIDYIQKDDKSNLGYGWSETMKKFFNKLKASSKGDEAVQRDLYTDFKTRYWALLKNNPYARGDFMDVVFMSFLTFMGLSLVFLGIFTSSFGDIGGLSALTETTSYGDHIMITSILLGIASISFWLSRRTASKTVVSLIKKPARGIAGLILFAQFFVVVYLGYSLILGGGQDALLQLELRIDNLIESFALYLPLDIQEPFLNAYESYRGPDSTVFGLSIVEASVFMAAVGIITTLPVLKRTIARLILTANMTPRQFREETGILLNEISEDDDFDGFDGKLYELGDESEREVEGDYVEHVDLEKVEDYEGLSGEYDNSEELLALPDSIKGSPFYEYEEVRRYWVRAPYSYVSIVYNERSNDYRYVVVEPELDTTEEIIFDELKERLDTVLPFEDVKEKEDVEEENEIKLSNLESRLIQLSQDYDIEVSDTTFHKLMYYVERDYIYYNKIDPMMNDPNVEDISCDGEDKHLFVFHSDYKDVITNVKFSKETLRSFVQELAQRSGEHISAADPMVDASLPDGSRAQMTLGSEVTTDGSTFTIRLFEEIPFTPIDLLDYRTFSVDQMSYLWTAIQHNKSLVFAGGTASGKTTSMNAVSLFIPPKSKVITIEDTREIKLPQKNWIPGTTREGLGEGSGEIDMFALLKAALRQRPEYLVVGEIRGKEAETLFQAMNTGHTTYSTMHAETVDAAIGRLTNPPISIPKQMITALDIVCIQNQIRFKDEQGNAKSVRRNQETREIVKLRDTGAFETRRPFQWNAETDTFIKSLDDSHVLARISEENGWDLEERDEQLNQRKEVLEYMLENNIREFEHVANVIQAYMVDPDNIIQKVRNDTLKPKELSSLTDMKWKSDEDKRKEVDKTTLNQLAQGDD